MKVLWKWNVEKLDKIIKEISEIYMSQILPHFPVHL